MTTRSQQQIANEIAEKILEHPDQVFIFFGQKKLRNVRWFMGFQEMFETLATDKEMTGKDLQVLLHLFGQCEFENYLMISQANMAKNLNIQRPNIARSLKKLTERGYIECRKAGRNNVYRINPDLIWKGKVVNREKIIQFPVKDESLANA